MEKRLVGPLRGKVAMDAEDSKGGEVQSKETRHDERDAVNAASSRMLASREGRAQSRSEQKRPYRGEFISPERTLSPEFIADMNRALDDKLTRTGSSKVAWSTQFGSVKRSGMQSQRPKQTRRSRRSRWKNTWKSM